MNIPVNKGNIIEGEIIDISHEGNGVVKLEGYTIFTEGGLIGDKVSVIITEIKKSYALGKTVKIIEPSKHRVDTKCSISDYCGGCSLQGLDYKMQLEFKTNKVKNDIKRIGGLDEVAIHNIIGMDNPNRYRNKVQIPVGMENGEAVIGFYKKGSHDIANIDTCVIQHDVADKAIGAIREYIKEFKIEPYDNKTGKGLLRHIIVKNSFKTGDTMVVLVTNGNILPHSDQFIKKLRDRIPELKTVIQNINTKKTNLVMGAKSQVIYGEEKIIDYIGNLKFYISAESFFQVNPVQTEVLYSKALEYADLKGNETVFDIYCGIGTISLFLAQKAKKVYGIESVNQAIKDAKENARINGIENVEFHSGNAEEIFPKLYEKGIKADVVVVDPPRKGCDPQVIDTIIKMKPEKVVYVSCNPSTLARDLKVLSENGFKVMEVQPVDMFPWTGHVESIILMTYCGSKEK
ncbi:23S rRNA (uracil(1939)-C(5))-methyltransferase RlmD [Proteiniborus sp. MB09-C3]|uniref:23S rRNA (uracil(1939)-C(5))-methyltransferase RlmD n=1 Tax=Proteiniborus sp. MB09-C3 TaxID=3050072 RepID=UPI0025553A4A|nr:23S rRNA (uracil(1939)-C(5))-methyltransferase RlmD [Proteiniborus sp. MB09-C3]WIV13553.1 23S rRNA (uracil(1939)-C(5))-methyltransferase RlmD [Proteiniborus sp. MB09-C3]